MKVLEERCTPEGKKILAELSVTEAALIQKAVTAPIKRKVMEMSNELIKLKDKVQDAIDFNDLFIDTFYRNPQNFQEVIPSAPTKSCIISAGKK